MQTRSLIMMQPVQSVIKCSLRGECFMEMLIPRNACCGLELFLNTQNLFDISMNLKYEALMILKNLLGLKNSIYFQYLVFTAISVNFIEHL